MRKSTLLLLVSVITVTFSACQNEPKTPSTNANVKSNANALTNSISNASTNSTANIANAPNSDIKRGTGEGKVTKIDLKLGSIEMDHGEIKGEAKMPPMLMEFYVKDNAIPKDLKVGDTVTFTLEDNKGAEQITDVKIKKAK